MNVMSEKYKGIPLAVELALKGTHLEGFLDTLELYMEDADISDPTLDDFIKVAEDAYDDHQSWLAFKAENAGMYLMDGVYMDDLA